MTNSLDDGDGVEKPKHVGRCGYPDCGGECVGCEQGDAERAQLASRPTRNAGVGVKALEWTPFWPENPEMAGRECAQTAFGTVYHVSSEGWWFAMCELNKHTSIDEAKAAAQADFIARILSALEPS